MSLSPGTRLAHYEILEAIGKGGMGEVYRARDGKLGRDVAIKVLPEEFAENEERLARFKREAKVLTSLNHPGLLPFTGWRSRKAHTISSSSSFRARRWLKGSHAVSMDMWEPYITVVGKKAPQARVIFDRFHIVKHLNEAVDKTRPGASWCASSKGLPGGTSKTPIFPFSRPNTTGARKTNGCSASRCERIVASTVPCCCATTPWIFTLTKARAGPTSFSEDGCGAP